LTAFLAALFYLPDIFWAVLLLGLTVTAAREWCRLGQFSVGQTVLYMILTTLLGGGTALSGQCGVIQKSGRFIDGLVLCRICRFLAAGSTFPVGDEPADP